MKTYHIKDPLKKDLLILELPEKTADFSVLNTGDAIAVCAFDEYDECLDVKSVSKDYTLLDKPDEISEDDAKELVEWGDADPVGDRFALGYRSYFEGYEDDIPQFTCNTATESLLSAVESVIFWGVNPLGEKPVFAYDFPEDGPSESMYDSAVDDFDLSSIKWHEAELRTFDRSRSIILVKQ